MARLLRTRRSRLLLLLFFLFVILVVATQSGWLDSAAKLARTNQPGLYRISQFVDGDTIAVDMNGHSEMVRFIGVDTPETHKPNTPVQCYGPEAAAFTKSFIGSQKVRLESDPLDTDRDRYDRLLRYVYLPDGTLVDEVLIEKGYGFAYLGFPFTKASQFAADQKTAQTAQAGLWGSCRPSLNEYGGYSSNPL